VVPLALHSLLYVFVCSKQKRGKMLADAEKSAAYFKVRMGSRESGGTVASAAPGGRSLPLARCAAGSCLAGMIA
jgi:hypothetical protein